MCGIIGIVGKEEVAPLLVDGLRRLEYRGYDSAGVATIVNSHIERRRAEGKLSNLARLLDRDPLPGRIGIGHTRWATHGAPTETNAHPHATDRVAIVHNGIIENYRELRAELEEKGCHFSTDTDSEIVAHLLTVLLNDGSTPAMAMTRALERLEGAFALAILIADQKNLLLAARRGSPLALGYGDGEMFVGSDALALAPLTRRISHFEEGDWAEVTQTGAVVHDRTGAVVERPIVQTAISGALIGKGNFRHFMQKEIYEQPAVIGDTLRPHINPTSRAIALPHLDLDLGALAKVTIIGCGTSWHAGMIGRYWIESLARIPCEIDIASEFRYRSTLLPANGLTVFISQSGETADTLAALRHARESGSPTLAIVNGPESSMAREANMTIPTHAGPEIGVASTKAFTTQLAVLACLAVAAGRASGALTHAREETLVQALTEAPSRVSEVLSHDDRLAKIAERVAEARDVLYLGRGTSFPVALEGALKLKEISYIHAEGYPAGEMKHGPIALIDETVPVIVVAPSDALFDKTASNLQEVAARGGRIILLSDRTGIERVGDLAESCIELPSVDPFIAPIVYTIPVQLLAYHVAVVKGTDVDQPRNLAKSVTVE